MKLKCKILELQRVLEELKLQKHGKRAFMDLLGLAIENLAVFHEEYSNTIHFVILVASVNTVFRCHQFLEEVAKSSNFLFKHESC